MPDASELQCVLNERSVYDQLGRYISQLLWAPRLSTYRRIGSTTLCMRSTPMEMASTSEKLFEVSPKVVGSRHEQYCKTPI
jgi:hypothetical protein